MFCLLGTFFDVGGRSPLQGTQWQFRFNWFPGWNPAFPLLLNRFLWFLWLKRLGGAGAGDKGRAGGGGGEGGGTSTLDGANRLDDDAIVLV